MKPASPDDLAVARLIAEVQDLTSAVRELVELTPTRSRVWLEPRDFARIAGVTTRTLCSWRASGRFADRSLRRGPRGWQFHSHNALQDIDAAGLPSSSSDRALLPPRKIKKAGW